jgi:hypothetical protein
MQTPSAPGLRWRSLDHQTTKVAYVGQLGAAKATMGVEGEFGAMPRGRENFSRPTRKFVKLRKE